MGAIALPLPPISDNPTHVYSTHVKIYKFLFSEKATKF